MATNEVFTGVDRGLWFYYSFFNTVSRELGIERALALQAKATENLMGQRGQTAQGKPGIQKLDAKTAGSLIKTRIESLGFVLETVEESPQRVKFKCTLCPMYAAARAMGTDDRAIEAICRASAIKMVDANVKRLNPDLTFKVTKFRSSPNDYCLEEIVQG